MIADAGRSGLPVAVPGAGEGLRNVMRRHPAGVVVITARVDEPTGFCATSFTSVSLEPPCVSFAVAARSASGRTWRRTSHGIVHLLAGDQQRLAESFAGSGPEKFADGWRIGPRGQPLLDGVDTWLLVRVRTRVVVGDHLLVIAEVEQAEQTTSVASLTYQDGTFYALPF